MFVGQQLCEGSCQYCTAPALRMQAVSPHSMDDSRMKLPSPGMGPNSTTCMPRDTSWQPWQSQGLLTACHCVSAQHSCTWVSLEWRQYTNSCTTCHCCATAAATYAGLWRLLGSWVLLAMRALKRLPPPSSLHGRSCCLYPCRRVCERRRAHVCRL